MFERKINTSKIDVSSKLNAKLSCLEACNYDVDKADKLYKFLTNDLKNLPETQTRITKFAQFKSNVSEGVSFIKENKDDLLGFFDFIKNFRTPKTAAPLDLPNIPKP